MEQGYIRIYRKIASSGYYHKSTYVHLWVHLLLKANYSENKFLWNGEVIIVKAGQFLTGRKQLSLETGIAESTIEDILKVLENLQQIRQQKTNKYRLITILNWEEYQKSDNNPTTKQQQADTNKNNKKNKNEREILSPPSEELINEMLSVYACNASQVKQKADAILNYCDSKKKTYKDYKATLRSWLNKDFGLKKIDHLMQ